MDSDRRGRSDSRAFGIAEPGTLDYDSSVALSSLFTNLRTNMFSFAVTVCPNEKNLSVAGLLLNVIRNWLVLLSLSAKVPEDVHATDRIDLCNGLCFEKLSWRRSLPFPVSICELKARQVTTDAGHGHRTIAPLRKVEIEFVVLDEGMTTNRSLQTHQ
jgi:hypothetical protein